MILICRSFKLCFYYTVVVSYGQRAIFEGPERWEEVAVGRGEGVDKVGQGHHQEDSWPQQVNQKTNNQPAQPMN